MSLFMEMKEFGDAASFLRLTNLEQLAARTMAFDGSGTPQDNLSSKHPDNLEMEIIPCAPNLTGFKPNGYFTFRVSPQ